VPLRSILLLTFSTAAAKELETRVKKECGGKRRKGGRSDFWDEPGGDRGSAATICTVRPPPMRPLFVHGAQIAPPRKHPPPPSRNACVVLQGSPPQTCARRRRQFHALALHICRRFAGVLGLPNDFVLLTGSRIRKARRPSPPPLCSPTHPPLGDSLLMHSVKLKEVSYRTNRLSHPAGPACFPRPGPLARESGAAGPPRE
jgi:hypothetical protein